MRSRGVLLVSASAVVVLGSGISVAAAPAGPAQIAGGEVHTQVLAFKNLYRWGGWEFTGVWTNGNHRFAGTATGSESTVWDDGQAVLYPFSIQSTSGHGTLSGTCSGSFSDNGDTASAVLTCTVSVNGSDPATVPISVQLADNTGSTDTSGGRTTDYYGVFRAG